jgi:hypothetical protein
MSSRFKGFPRADGSSSTAPSRGQAAELLRDVASLRGRQGSLPIGPSLGTGTAQARARCAADAAFYAKPDVKRGKTDAVDAEAICEAVRRPTMRLVEIKSTNQQALLAIHRTRDLVVRQRTQIPGGSDGRAAAKRPHSSIGVEARLGDDAAAVGMAPTDHGRVADMSSANEFSGFCTTLTAKPRAASSS